MWLPSRSAIMLLSMKWPSGSGPLHMLLRNHKSRASMGATADADALLGEYYMNDLLGEVFTLSGQQATGRIAVARAGDGPSAFRLPLRAGGVVFVISYSASPGNECVQHPAANCPRKTCYDAPSVDR